MLQGGYDTVLIYRNITCKVVKSSDISVRCVRWFTVLNCDCFPVIDNVRRGHFFWLGFLSFPSFCPFFRLARVLCCCRVGVSEQLWQRRKRKSREMIRLHFLYPTQYYTFVLRCICIRVLFHYRHHRARTNEITQTKPLHKPPSTLCLQPGPPTAPSRSRPHF